MLSHSRFVSRWLVCAALALGGGCGLGPPDLPARAARPVTLLVEPAAGPAAIVGLLSAARQSLWMEMYLLTAEDAIAALEDRARAGCDVRVTLEPAPYESADANQEAYARLAAAGVAVRWATSRFSYTHAKAFTVDHARLVVMTLNLTGAGLGGNREYAAVDDDPADVAAAEVVFVADQSGAPAGSAARVVTSPDGSRPTIAHLIAAASASLALETEELTDPAILRALLDARGRGVTETVVWPGPAAGAPSAFQTLAAAGATVRALATPEVHAKALAADGAAAYLGSANLTPTSLDRNREVGLALADPAIAVALEATIAGDAARGTAP